ncbi:ubiquinol oxidase [Chloropicon primus]|uniref:Ubiquinol oxidase n=2 Tax=Chloropicon primus TaxID=1764295 RepID=A0A5B8MLW0_9CHLO|nr:ubiquinol oxidase [Chloropicon primus]|eukprot:QDZ20645.1 ubiquinol oxidase [Chloropicon primus]
MVLAGRARGGRVALRTAPQRRRGVARTLADRGAVRSRATLEDENKSKGEGKSENENESENENVPWPECEYSFTAKGSSGVEGPSTPSSVAVLAVSNFRKEWQALREWQASRKDLELTQDSGYYDEGSSGPGGGAFELGSMGDEELCVTFEDQLKKLTLDAEGIYERELKRQKDGDYFKKKSWIIKGPYIVLCWALDRLYGKDRPIQRFWLLETVARMPYFSYISMLHLYETLGWWRKGAAVKSVHFAEEWNEFNHLLIMESLGGDDSWIDRFAGYHGAIVYYWVLNLLWLISPYLAYQFSELLENHAVDTYSQFVDENEELLRTLPAPAVAKNYYQNEDLYMFDEFQTSRSSAASRRRPQINTLYDTFSNIRDDELEHVKTMVACQNTNKSVRSPHQSR